MKDPAFAKLVVFVNSLVPAALLGWDWAFARDRLGANAIEFTLHATGLIALVFLMLTLSITPLRKLGGWNFLSHFRRMLGLFAYFYAVLHLCIYIGLDQQLDLGHVLQEVVRRKFILFGMSAALLLTPLALTSTNASIKRMGAVKWKRLHRLIYPAAFLALTHFWMSLKADVRIPMAFTAVLAALLGYRVVAAAMAALKRRRAAAVASPDASSSAAPRA